VLLGVTEVIEGAPGRVAGVVGADATELVLAPAIFTATTVTLYEVPLVKAVIVQVSFSGGATL
jgi:hypothetical protein